MEQLIGNLNYRLDVATTEESVLAAILETHIQFKKIHPFQMGMEELKGHELFITCQRFTAPHYQKIRGK